MKKIITALLALVMVLSVCTVAFAATTATTTITAPANTRNYDVYQILTGDLSTDGKLSNVVWGQNATKTGDASEADLNTLAGLTEADEIAAYVDFNSTKIGTVTNGSSITVPTGYYLVKDMGPIAAGEAYSLYVIQVVGPTTIQPKTDTTKVEKNIVEGSEKVKKNNASVGDVVNYEIVGTVPSNIDDYKTYYYCFNDTLSEGLTYNDDVVIKIGGTDVTDKFTVTAENGVITASVRDLKTVATLTGDTKVVMTYSATLNEKAVINGENPNEVDLKYSNNPNKSGNGEPGTDDHPTGTTPKDKVVTYVTELVINKVDGAGDMLTGAAFKLEGTGVVKTKVTGSKFEKAPYTATTGETVLDGTYYLLNNGSYTTTAPTTQTAAEYASTTDTYVNVDFAKWIDKDAAVSKEAFVDENGKLVFTGIGEGTYTLTETVTPDGYNAIKPMTVTVKFDEATNKFYIDEKKVVDGDGNVTADSMTMEMNVVNKQGTELPETGGMGTKMFYLFGALLAVAAAVVFVAKKRVSAKG